MRTVAGMWAFFRMHPAVAITIAYIQMCFIGSAFQAGLLSRFGINYFDHAVVEDLILAALGRFDVTIGGMVASVLAVAAVVGFTTANYRRGAAFAVLYPVFAILLPSVFGGMVATSIREGWGTYIRLRLTPGVELPVPASNDILLITSATSTIFLYDRTSRRSLALKRDHVAWQETCGSKGQRPDPTSPWAPTLPDTAWIGKSCFR